jgi:hypothetical protein
VIVTAALRAPVAAGVNVTLIVQLVFVASVDGDSGQVVVRAKSAAFVPLTTIVLIVSAPGPLLVTVTLCAVLVVPVV